MTRLRSKAAVARYEMSGETTRAVFDYAFERDTELSGHMKLRLWVEADGSDDMDLFVAIQKLERDGTYVPFVFYAMNEDGPVALGWLRASHRALDESRSRPEQPVHTHDAGGAAAPGRAGRRWTSRSGRHRRCSGRVSSYGWWCRGGMSSTGRHPMRRSPATRIPAIAALTSFIPAGSTTRTCWSLSSLEIDCGTNLD